MADRDHELSKALAEFTTYVIDRFEADDQSAKNQLLVRGVFAGASCGSLVDYAKEMRSFAHENMSIVEIAEIVIRSTGGKIRAKREDQNEGS